MKFRCRNYEACIEKAYRLRFSSKKGFYAEACVAWSLITYSLSLKSIAKSDNINIMKNLFDKISMQIFIRKIYNFKDWENNALAIVVAAKPLRSEAKRNEAMKRQRNHEKRGGEAETP